MSSVKINRINSELVRTLSSILLLETDDEFMKSVTITAADTASDLSSAKVYFTSLVDKDKQELEKEMNEASDFFRKFVASKMDLRQTPKLRFYYDDSVSYGNKIESILHEIHEKNE